MSIRIAAVLVTILLSLSANAKIYKQVKVYETGKETIEKLSAFDIVSYKPGEYIEIVIDEAGYVQFKSLALRFEVIHEDLTAFYQSRYPLGTTMDGFRTYDEVMAVLDSLSTAYPNLVTPKTSIGQSIQRRELWMVKVSDNPDIDEDEPEIFINGLHHAREPITIEVCIEFIKELTTNYGIDPEITQLVDNNEFFIIPIVNPDGYEYNRQTYPAGGGMWRKNRHNNGDGSYGVDLNRNYPYFWGYDNSGSSGNGSTDTYRGSVAGSEPEIQAMMAFIQTHDFAWVMNFHSYGNYVLWPYGYYDGVAEEDNLFWELFGNYGEDTLGYTAGTPWQVLYNTNGDANDWGYGDQRSKPKTYALTIEIGNDLDGFWPETYRIPQLVSENIQALLNFSHKAYEIYKRRQPSIPQIISPAMAPAQQSFIIRWQTEEIDTFNTAASYRVIEKAGYSRISQTCETATPFVLDNFSRSFSRSHAGTYSLYSGHGDDYRAVATLKERLLVQPWDTLTFWTWYDIESEYDYAYVEVSTDGGRTWQMINGNRSSVLNPNNHNKGYGITGNSGGWVEAKYYINQYTGQQVDIRFRYWTDGSVNNEGIYIDDIFPYDSFASENVLTEYAYQESLSVGPHEPGTYYFQVAARDDRGDLSFLSNLYAVDVTDDTYSLTGLVELSDSPDNLAGSEVAILGLGMSDSTAVVGTYSIDDIPAGIYDIKASHHGYYDSIYVGYELDSNSNLDFFLSKMPLAAPQLIFPADSTTIDTLPIAFDWADVEFAAGYIIEISTNTDFNELVAYDSSLTESNYQLPVIDNDTYYWRVTAFNATEVSSRSETRSFTVDCEIYFIPGDANGDGRVIGSDVTYLVGYFRGINSPPSPFLAGDANGDCRIIGSDVTYLVTYFRGIGPPPRRGDCPSIINYHSGSAEDLTDE